MADYDNFTLIEGDVMALDLAAVTAEKFPGLPAVLCANLPYNITTPFLTACVRAGCFRQLTVLIQKEVALRICAKPGTADYGAFSLLMQYYTVPELLFEVPNSCFMPPPKVTSAVVRCVTRKAPPVQVRSEEAFWRTVRAGFALRRKTLVNSLQTGWGGGRGRRPCGARPWAWRSTRGCPMRCWRQRVNKKLPGKCREAFYSPFSIFASVSRRMAARSTVR